MRTKEPLGFLSPAGVLTVQTFVFGEYEWDIHRALLLIKKNDPRVLPGCTGPGELACGILHTQGEPDPHPHRPVPPNPIEGFGVYIDKRRALRADVDPLVPGIAIVPPWGDGTGAQGIMLIDGWKRAYKAWYTGQELTYFYTLNADAEREIRLKG